MNHRMTEAYSHVFRFIEENVFELQPSAFITDYEQAMRNAINDRWEGVTLRGCWYHYSAALRKKMLKLGLSKLFKDFDDAKTIKKMMMALPLLPPEKFDEGFQYVKKKAKALDLHNEFKDFFVYFDYWVNQVIKWDKISCN